MSAAPLADAPRATLRGPRAWSVRGQLVPLHVALLSLLVAIAYYPSLDVPFVFDDVDNIVANPYVHADTAAEVWRALDSPQASQRPLAMLSFAANYLVGALDPRGYHIVNVLIHLVNALLLYALVANLPAGRAAAGAAPRLEIQTAFWAAALWALNPVQTQAVTYIVQRMTSLAALFYLLALLLFVLARAGRMSPVSAAVGIVAAFALGLASKQIVATLPLALLLVDRVFFARARLRPHLVLAAIAVVAGVGIAFLQGRMPAWNEPFLLRDYTPLERVMTQPRMLWHYLSLELVPWPGRLHLDYDVEVSRSLWQPMSTAVAFVATFAAAGAAWWCRHRAPIASFAVLFFFLASAVESSFVSLELAFVHRAYLPCAFLFAGILSLVPARLLARGGLVVLALTALFAQGTINRNIEWRTGAELWGRDLERGASPMRALVNRSIDLAQRRHFDQAIAELRRATEAEGRFDEHLLASYELAIAHYERGDLEHAIAILDRLIGKVGNWDVFLFYSAMARLDAGRRDEAAAHIELVLSHPETPYARVLEARLAVLDGEPERGARVLELALEEAADASPVPRNYLRMHLANVYLALERYGDAYQLYVDAIRVHPDNFFAWTQLYRMQMSAGDTDNARRIRRFLESRGVDVPPTGAAAGEDASEAAGGGAAG